MCGRQDCWHFGFNRSDCDIFHQTGLASDCVCGEINARNCPVHSASAPSVEAPAKVDELEERLLEFVREEMWQGRLNLTEPRRHAYEITMGVLPFVAKEHAAAPSDTTGEAPPKCPDCGCLGLFEYGTYFCNNSECYNKKPLAALRSKLDSQSQNALTPEEAQHLADRWCECDASGSDCKICPSITAKLALISHAIRGTP
jgi:hypothetical protein